VLYTGRSIRAGMDAINSFGRPQQIELLVLIDRRFSRELPIEPNYVGKTVDAIDTEKVLVEWSDTNNKNDLVRLIRE
jgi:pyrimidine operon attenuation protein/uracil phosphoribosyltransferase